MFVVNRESILASFQERLLDLRRAEALEYSIV